MAKKTVRVRKTTKKYQLQSKEKKNNFINALIKNNYHITNTMDELGMARSTYYDWKLNDSDFAATLEKLRDNEVDVIEDAFRDLIKERNPQTVIFGLKTRGANRGYQEKQHIEYFGAAKIQVEFVTPSDEKRVTVDGKVKEDD